MSRIRQAEQDYYRSDLPDFDVGNTVEVSVRIREGGKERVQVFAGTVIRIRGGGLGRTFTVLKIVAGEGVERIFPIHSPIIAGIEITRRGRVRRSRLYYLRDRVGKSTRLREIIGHRPPKSGARTPAKPAASEPESQPAPEEAATEA